MAIVYPSSEGPRYLPGGSATAAVALLVAVLALIVRLVLQRDNKKLAAGQGLSPDSSVEGRGASVAATAQGFRYVL